ncbi:general stress protein [Aestuariimicrobium ganziense]|uniref:general stress protein n=1 Tax=Aestuariimicrobium ganziense TaxID=2773677 RepID=UPI001F1ABC19|nr:general stress protein [Aestuariimicrobium ganziense]
MSNPLNPGGPTTSALGAAGRPTLTSLLTLKYPQSIIVLDSYDEASKAVDFLADQKFPVDQLCIVGTDLKTIERVTGRKTWGSVLLQGATSGVFMGLLVGLMLSLFTQGSMLAMILAGVVFGVLFGAVSSAMGYAMSGGKRDFNSIAQTVATKYEVLGEHKVAAQARELLTQMPGQRAKMFE